MSSTATDSTATGGPGNYGNYDICGPLPGPGVTMLEASAGTGKTFTIAALVTRMVAEGMVPLSEILVVTFTRMATGDLRERVRRSLADVEAGLALVLSGAPSPPGNPVLDLLAQGDSAEVTRRRQRLADALAGFDAATVTTTHGFCHAVLAALGARGEVAEGAALLEEPADLVEEVVDDLFLRHVLRSGPLPFRRSVALQVGAQAVANPGTPLDPPAERGAQDAAGLQRRFAAGVRQEVRSRLFDANLLTYDGLLVRLAETLSRPGRGDAACARLRQKYRAVLVDEFQDTDLVQWDVVRLAFAGSEVAVVLIGDPKQAIYSFRGADVYAYLDAARGAGPSQRFTLECNWRSDLDLLNAYNALLTPLQLGHPEIAYRTAQATAAHRKPGLTGAPCSVPLRVRLVPRQAPWARKTSRGLLQTSAARRLIAEDLADDIVDLLSAGAALVKWAPDGEARVGQPAPVGPGDIGVLVRTNRQAALVQSALRAVGVPAVVAGADSVLTTAAARHWLNLLEALEQPASRSLAVAVALGPFVGMTAAEVATSGEERWESLHDLLHQWAALVRDQGIASLYAAITVSQELPPRLLSEVDGERHITDLGHVAELLHAQSTRDQLGLAALRAWLARRADEAVPDGADADQRSRRLDSGSDAVQLLTVHRAKGLEFPIVYCPYLWDPGRPQKHGGPVVFHDPDDGYRRKLDAGGDETGPGYRRHYALYQAERRGEDLRLLYVALTRSRHQTVIWWAGAQDAQHSALGRLLLRRDADGQVTASGTAGVPKDEHVHRALEQLGPPSLISTENVGPPRAERWLGPVDESGDRVLAVARFHRSLDYRWRRSSYTSITASAHELVRGHSNVGSEPEDAGTIDEPGAGTALLAQPVAQPAPDGTRPSLLASMPAGAEIGTFVHRVLERADFAAPDLRPHLMSLLSAPELGYPGPTEGLAEVADGLAAAIETPLGPLAGGLALRDLSRADRLDELGFELPVAGGEAAGSQAGEGEVLISDFGLLWGRHVRPGQPLAGYAGRLGGPALAREVRGYLTGSLDLVFRARSGPCSGRYFVVDYKTNWLAPSGGPLTSWHYRGEALEDEMQRAHYPLQAILYLVALHRYLRWRLRGYRPADHLGGALYLFLRGMGGATATAQGEVPAGVFAWRPPVALVTELSDLLARGSP